MSWDNFTEQIRKLEKWAKDRKQGGRMVQRWMHMGSYPMPTLEKHPDGQWVRYNDVKQYLPEPKSSKWVVGEAHETGSFSIKRLDNSEELHYASPYMGEQCKPYAQGYCDLLNRQEQK